MEEGREQETCAGYVDWRSRPSLKGKHGGMRAASFVLVVEVMENLAFLANASNLVTYLSKFMHMSPAKSATTVTNFMGTAFLLALLGGFLSDAFFTTYTVYLTSATLQILGLVLLMIQARSLHLKPPPPCKNSVATSPCSQVITHEAAVLFTGLYLVALGVGGIKGSLPSHGAEQFDDATPKGRKQRSTFFNYFVFCLSAGALVAVTLVVWLEDNKGWQWGFGVSTTSILLSIPVFLSGSRYYRNKIPSGSPLTLILKVIASMILRNGKSILQVEDASSGKGMVRVDKSQGNGSSNQLKDNSAEVASFRLSCTMEEVHDVKAVLATLPIFVSTIMLNCCLAQLSTFSVQQAATMDTSLGRLTVPPASLPVFPVIFIMILAPLYNHLLVPLSQKVMQSEKGVSQLQRIGIGLMLSILAMAVAALAEVKRRRVAMEHLGVVDAHSSLPITFLWIALQYLFLGSADLFTLAGLLEFFFSEAPARMRSLATSFSWASLAMGYYLSSALVGIVNRVAEAAGHTPWLGGSDLNSDRLDLFYWLMCVLSALNFLNFWFWAYSYKYRSLGALITTDE